MTATVVTTSAALCKKKTSREFPGSITENEFKEEASNLAFAFWDRMGEFLKRSRTGSELSPDEKTLWLGAVASDGHVFAVLS